MLTYVVDVVADRIVEIDGPWDGFAALNGAPLLTRAAARSRSFLSFVAGAEMKELTKGILGRARGGETLALEFRCDSPAERRHLLFECFGLSGAAVQCSTTLLRAEPRPSQRLIDASVARSDDVILVCSWCCRFRLDGPKWVEVEEAVSTLRLFDGTPIPKLTHGVCPACAPVLRGQRLHPP